VRPPSMHELASRLFTIKNRAAVGPSCLCAREPCGIHMPNVSVGARPYPLRGTQNVSITFLTTKTKQ
jgi:hypothetical protein